jgi:hypothetical protein
LQRIAELIDATEKLSDAMREHAKFDALTIEMLNDTARLVEAL